MLLLASLVMPLASAAAQDSSPGDNPPAQDGTVQAAIREILSAQTRPLPEIAGLFGNRPLEWLRTFYAGRDGAPLWLSAAASPAAADWVMDRSPEAIPAAVEPLLTAAAAIRRQNDPRARAQLDLLLSAIYAMSSVAPNDALATQEGSQALVLLSVSQDRQKLLRDTLPRDPGFWRLREAVELYRGLAAVGGWPAVPDGPNIQLGDGGPRVVALRQRLVATGDLAAAALQDGAYDDVLKQAVQHFQARHGLQTDGIVGRKTLAALNVPVKQRLGVMAANLGRLQRQHRDWGRRYIAVNIAAASYRLVVDGKTVFERPAVVGKPSWPTPMLDGLIDHIEFHPYWRIPMKIADQEVWPKQDADPNYFAAQGIRIVNGQLVQDPGPRNPLGAVKFLFDNPYSVYLHDTSAPAWFARDYRFASHGCIRVSQADDLARELLAADPQWPGTEVDAVLQGTGNRTVVLREPIPLHIVYETAWVSEDNTIQFRDDVYHYDVITPEAASQSGLVADAGTPSGPAGGCAG